ncbi:MAG: hypothetical protein GF411_03320 [Candidatus Lokiarchaeota archaeon]|nr:hypothetical protein [Candidatus Lokiarchaeota archaeon]
MNLKELLEFIPEEGILKLGSQRMVILPADSMGRLIRMITSTMGKEVLDEYMFELGEASGRKDAETLKRDFAPESEMDWITLGPAMHSWEGIVHAVPEKVRFDRSRPTFLMSGRWENSFYAEQWLDQLGQSKEPVCSLLVGYAKGYSSVFIGAETEARELQCIAQGHEYCRWEIRLKEDWTD